MLHVTPRFTIFVGLVILATIVFGAPNVLPQSLRDALPSWWPREPISLGLDLRGGSSLLLSIDMETMRNDRIETLLNDARRTLRAEKIGNVGAKRVGDAVEVQISSREETEKATNALRSALGTSAVAVFAGQSPAITVTSSDTGLITLAYTESGWADVRTRAVQQSIEIVRRRVDELGTREPAIQQQGADRILVQVPGLSDPQRLKDILGKTAKMTFHLVHLDTPVEDVLNGAPRPPGTTLMEMADGSGQKILIESRVLVSGENLVDAQQSFDSRTNEVVVSFRFDTTGARRFADITRENVGRPFAIVLDGKVVTAPVINEPITTGSGQISGGGAGFSVQEANDLALVLRAGALPAPLTIIEERTVGPDLGADSIAAGQLAALLGMGAVFVFMVVCYGLFGVFANVALAVNIAMIFSVMTAIDSTLTLPGIAGIVLTIGMAVDANVLIYERMREEAALGKPAISAMDAGFSRALGTIIDSNLTTVLAVGLLFIFGSGPIRGFAVALIIGIGCSMFTAVTLTRVIIAYWVWWTRPKVLPI
ncbi:MAG: protein translocase subunit SecD [Alphaproteobacteria bacterium]|nr:protein translocase subunit SecD [Alphaproteobacteria bacterium]